MAEKKLSEEELNDVNGAGDESGMTYVEDKNDNQKQNWFGTNGENMRPAG